MAITRWDSWVAIRLPQSSSTPISATASAPWAAKMRALAAT